MSGRKYLGGLVGSNLMGTITNSYAAGTVSGSESVGGLVGDNHGAIGSSIAFNTRLIRTEGVASTFHRIAIVGSGAAGSNNYANENMIVNGSVVTGGELNNENGADISVNQFKNSSIEPLSLLGWDFGKIWEIKAEADRPTLQNVGDDNGKI